MPASEPVYYMYLAVYADGTLCPNCGCDTYLEHVDGTTECEDCGFCCPLEDRVKPE